jgi:DNA-binding NarL/FixJ family response regulator
MKEVKTILLADDHVIIRRGLKALIDNNMEPLKWVETDNVTEIIKILNEQIITHMVLDMQLLNSNIMDILQQVLSNYRHIPVLIYTMSPEEIYAPRLLKMGVSGFLSKQSDELEVVSAMHLFLNGSTYFSSRVKSLTSEKPFKRVNPMMQLSERELSVLGYLLQGISVKDISLKLEIKATTTATYKARIFDKLNVNNLIELKNLVDLINEN